MRFWLLINYLKKDLLKASDILKSKPLE